MLLFNLLLWVFINYAYDNVTKADGDTLTGTKTENTTNIAIPITVHNFTNDSSIIVNVTESGDHSFDSDETVEYEDSLETPITVHNFTNDTSVIVINDTEKDNHSLDSGETVENGKNILIPITVHNYTNDTSMTVINITQHDNHTFDKTKEDNTSIIIPITVHNFTNDTSVIVINVTQTDKHVFNGKNNANSTNIVIPITIHNFTNDTSIVVNATESTTVMPTSTINVNTSNIKLDDSSNKAAKKTTTNIPLHIEVDSKPPMQKPSPTHSLDNDSSHADSSEVNTPVNDTSVPINMDDISIKHDFGKNKEIHNSVLRISVSIFATILLIVSVILIRKNLRQDTNRVNLTVEERYHGLVDAYNDIECQVEQQNNDNIQNDNQNARRRNSTPRHSQPE